jgi:hypothetical protein
MVTVLVISVFGAWAVLSVLGGEIQRQRQNVELVEMSKRKARDRAERIATQMPLNVPAATHLRPTTPTKPAVPSKPEAGKGKGHK